MQVSGEVDTRVVLVEAALRRAADAARVVVAEVGRAARVAAEPGPMSSEPLPLDEMIARYATGAQRSVLLYAVKVEG